MEIYIEAQRITLSTGIPHEVDHIIPLRGRLVSGLHVHENLRIIPRTENRKKGNRFESDWWAILGSNQWLPPCEGGTLPLSYAPDCTENYTDCLGSVARHRKTLPCEGG